MSQRGWRSERSVDRWNVEELDEVEETIEISVHQRPSFWKTRADRRDGFGEIREEGRDGFSTTLEDQRGGGGKKCNMKFLDADVSRPLASVSATVNDENFVVFGPQESYIEATSTGQRIRMTMSKRKGVLVVQMDAQAGSRPEKTVKIDEPNTNERTPFFRRFA